MIRKEFNNTLRLCYYIFIIFMLRDNMIILFKLRDIFPKVFVFSFQFVIDRF
jgi:hypothetical protein